MLAIIGHFRTVDSDKALIIELDYAQNHKNSKLIVYFVVHSNTSAEKLLRR